MRCVEEQRAGIAREESCKATRRIAQGSSRRVGISQGEATNQRTRIGKLGMSIVRRGTKIWRSVYFDGFVEFGVV